MFLPKEIELSGVEVRLRSLRLEDAAELLLGAQEDRSKYLYNWVPDSLEDTQAYIQSALSAREKGLRYPFAIEWKSRTVGTTSYSNFQPWVWGKHGRDMQRDSPDVVEIGSTWVAASAQRTMCNSEAKYLLFHYAFEDWQVHRVALRTDERNETSRSAIQRLGASFDGIRRADVPGWDGTVRNSAYYSVVAAEWPKVKAAMEDRLYG